MERETNEGIPAIYFQADTMFCPVSNISLFCMWTVCLYLGKSILCKTPQVTQNGDF